MRRFSEKYAVEIWLFIGFAVMVLFACLGLWSYG